MYVDYIDIPPRCWWRWNFPELKKEIPTLFNIAGAARVRGRLIDGYLTVKIALHEPAKVVDWKKEWGDGIAINPDTNACIALGDFTVRQLPRPGDTKIILEVPMFIETSDKEQVVTLEDARQLLRGFAEQMTKTWYYHFK